MCQRSIEIECEPRSTYPELWSCFLWIFRLADPSFTLVVSGTLLVFLPLFRIINGNRVKRKRLDIRKSQPPCQPNPKKQSMFFTTMSTVSPSDAPWWTNITTHVFGCWTILSMYIRLLVVLLIGSVALDVNWNLFYDQRCGCKKSETCVSVVRALATEVSRFRVFLAQRTRNPRVNQSNG